MTTDAAASLSRTAREALAAFAAYSLVAFLYFGLRPLIEPGSQYVGVFNDPQIFIWSFAWWLHAIEHFQDPFVTHAVWAPTGLNLAWVTTVPALSLVFAPLTALAGPVASYDIAAVLMPALSAWTAYLLCRHLTSRFWPSLVGGYLFGFSAYEIGHVEGELHLTAIFVLPLIALVIVRRFEGQVTRRRFTIELGLLLALQVYLATEVTVTLTVVLALALVVGYAFGRARRPDVVALVKPIALGYVVAGLLVLPLIYHALSKVHQGEYQPPNEYTSDVLNFVVPTRLEARRGLGTDNREALPGEPLRAGRADRAAAARDHRDVRTQGVGDGPRPLPARPAGRDGVHHARARADGVRAQPRSASDTVRSRQDQAAGAAGPRLPHFRQRAPGAFRGLRRSRLCRDRRVLDPLDRPPDAALAPSGAGGPAARPEPLCGHLVDELLRAVLLRGGRLPQVPRAERERAAAPIGQSGRRLSGRRSTPSGSDSRADASRPRRPAR